MSQHIPFCVGTRALLTLVMGELFFRLRLAEPQRSPNHLLRARFLAHPDFSSQQRPHRPQMSDARFVWRGVMSDGTREGKCSLRDNL